MALMNGARLGIAAQSVGLSQAAYNEGLAYARDREQFWQSHYRNACRLEHAGHDQSETQMPAVRCSIIVPVR